MDQEKTWKFSNGENGTMTKLLELSYYQWHELLVQLQKEFSPKSFSTGNGFKEKLGFTPITHSEWNENMGKYGGWRKNSVMLEFDSREKRTWFIMKYAEYIKEELDDNF